ncbi:hypothetical protein ABZ553_17835 [Streptomyces sparsogenes]|uniref:hypothetical protein n=1 Tax=Streptomyces sparsogenes TaxID=67365 RepID=UPI0033FB1E57
MNLSRRSYVLIAALVLGLLALAYAGSRGARGGGGGGDAATWSADDPCLKDVSVPPVEYDGPRLTGLAHGYASESHLGGRMRFTIDATITTDRRPLALRTPLAPGSVSVRVCAPHGKGLMAQARGLSPRSVKGAGARSGRIRVTRADPLYFTVELPRSALRNGYGMRDLVKSTPKPGSNDAADYPVLVLTFTDPGLDEPLVSVSYKPDSAPTAQALGAPPRAARPLSSTRS